MLAFHIERQGMAPLEGSVDYRAVTLRGGNESGNYLVTLDGGTETPVPTGHRIPSLEDVRAQARLPRCPRRCQALLGLLNRSAPLPASTCTVSPGDELAGEDLQRQRVLQVPLDGPLERPRAVDRVVAVLGEELARLGGELERRAAGPRAACASRASWISTMRPMLLAPERLGR